MKTTISILVIAALASRAEANPAQAQVLFRDGVDLMEHGKIVEACDAFAASQRAAPTIATLVNLAICRELNNQLATAWGLYLEVVRQTRGVDEQAARAAFQLAVDKATALEPRISKLTINVPSDSRVELLSITQNGVPVDEGTWNRSMPVDGGRYAIAARAPGSTEWSTTIEIAIERDTKTIDIPKLAMLTKPPAPPSPVPVLVEQRTRSNTATFVLGGAAVAAIGLGLGLELSARSTYDRAQDESDREERSSLHRSANTKRYAAEAFAVAGIGCAGVAVWMYLRGRRDESRVAVQPVVDRNHAGVGVTGRF